ncbi:MAG: TolC family protein [candidate division Zixibacteria bacterium]|nr:TolC family protein [candidate division Zixibacteria bacterium]
MTKLTLRAWLLLILLLSLVALSPVLAAALTIDQSVALALKNNESYLVARAQLEKADADVTNAVAGALPNIDFSGTYSRNHEVSTVVFGGESFRLGTLNNINLGLTLTQPIYQGGKLFSAIRIASLYRKYISEMVRESEGEIIFGVRQAFLAAILAQNVVGVYRDAVATAELNRDMVGKMYNQGVVSEYEALRAEVELANLKPQLIQAENRAAIALDYLKNLIGLPLDEPVELVYQLDSCSLSHTFRLDYLKKVAADNRPAIREREYYQEMLQKAIGVARAGYRPNIELRSSMTWTYQADEFDVGFNDFNRSWTTSLNVSMPLFDGFATSAAVKKARLDYHSSRLLAEQTRDQVALEVKEAHLTYLEIADRLEAQAKTVAQAQEGLRIARLRYQSGVGTQLEVLSAEAALTMARTNYIQATHDAALAVYRLQRVTGADNIEELKEP